MCRLDIRPSRNLNTLQKRSLLVAGPPNALKSFEQAQSVLDASSAKTPKIEREPDAPGWMKIVLSAVRGLMRTIPPSRKFGG